ncbi:MAG: hypothetical protein WHX53_07480, partial [Anaerolineae bacterium]
MFLVDAAIGATVDEKGRGARPCAPTARRAAIFRADRTVGIALLLCALTFFLAGCFGGTPAPTEAPEVEPSPAPETATPESTRSVIPSAVATPLPTPTVTPIRRPTPLTSGPTATLPPVVLIRPSPAAPTATVEAWPTPIWPPSPLDRTNNILVMGMDR